MDDYMASTCFGNGTNFYNAISQKHFDVNWETENIAVWRFSWNFFKVYITF